MEATNLQRVKAFLFSLQPEPAVEQANLSRISMREDDPIDWLMTRSDSQHNSIEFGPFSLPIAPGEGECCSLNAVL